MSWSSSPSDNRAAAGRPVGCWSRRGRGPGVPAVAPGVRRPGHPHRHPLGTHPQPAGSPRHGLERVWGQPRRRQRSPHLPGSAARGGLRRRRRARGARSPPGRRRGIGAALATAARIPASLAGVGLLTLGLGALGCLVSGSAFASRWTPRGSWSCSCSPWRQVWPVGRSPRSLSAWRCCYRWAARQRSGGDRARTQLAQLVDTVNEQGRAGRPRGRVPRPARSGNEPPPAARPARRRLPAAVRPAPGRLGVSTKPAPRRRSRGGRGRARRRGRHRHGLVPLVGRVPVARRPVRAVGGRVGRRVGGQPTVRSPSRSPIRPSSSTPTSSASAAVNDVVAGRPSPRSRPPPGDGMSSPSCRPGWRPGSSSRSGT